MKYLILIISLSIMSCSNHVMENTFTAQDYKGEKPSFQKFVGGAPGSASGVELFIPAYLVDIEQVQVVYFRGMSTSNIYFLDQNKKTLVARLLYPNKKDFNMNVNAEKELGNTPPLVTLPKMDLSDDEALIQIKSEEKKPIFIKISDLEERPSQQRPTMRPQ